MTNRKMPVWPKKITATLCSPVFFIGVLFVGTLLGAGPLEGLGGRDMGRGERPDLRMVVIATVPDPERPGARRVEPVMLASLQVFKERNPDYSLLPPRPAGSIENPVSGMHTDYRVVPSAEGALVETSFRHELLTVQARYVATRTEVKPLYTKAGSVINALLIGLGLASVLAIIGRVMKYSIQHREARGRLGRGR